MAIIVRFPHNIRSGPIQELVERYQKFCSRYTKLDIRVGVLCDARGKALPEILELTNKCDTYILSERGRSVTTDWFRDTVSASAQSKPLLFIIGDANGFPASLESGARGLISLTPLTLPHEMALMILCEQIWRGISIIKNHPYHK